jgi:type VI secretion system protein ImpJ
MSGYVHWHEGLFLQPHHLQMMQRGMLQQFSTERRLLMPYPYGVVEAQLSADALANLRITFERLHVVMPSGMEVRLPGNALLPTVSIKERYAASSDPITVSIGVPQWDPHRANTVGLESQDWRLKRLYRVEEMPASDENTGQNQQTMQVRRINARIVLDGEDTSDLDVLPLFRIQAAGGEAKPKRDEQFMPPCMVVGGWPDLRQLVLDVTNIVTAARRNLVQKIRSIGVSVDTMRGKDFIHVVRLMTLNRFSARLGSLVKAPNISPFEWYLELRDLMGELAALDPGRDPFELPGYDHDRPGPVFHEIKMRLTPQLEPEDDETLLKVPLTREQENYRFVCEMAESHFTAPNEYFLGVRTREDQRTMTELVEDTNRCKLMPFSLSGKRIFGIPLEREANPPAALPVEPGLHHFRLHRGQNERLWEQIKTEGKFVVEGRLMEFSDVEMTLFMTVPQGAIK